MSLVLRVIIACVAVLLAGCSAFKTAPPAAPTSQAAIATVWKRPSNQVLQERWWTWAGSSPEDRNPVTDTTGSFCGENQPEDLWFFAGTFSGTANRTCQVPAGRQLVGPALNRYGPEADCGSFLTDASGSVTLDGQPVPLERVAPVPITFTATKNNALGVATGVAQTYACGLWAWVPPLPAGDHELRVEGASGNFSTSVRYRLTAVG